MHNPTALPLTALVDLQSGAHDETFSASEVPLDLAPFSSGPLGVHFCPRSPGNYGALMKLVLCDFQSCEQVRKNIFSHSTHKNGSRAWHPCQGFWFEMEDS